MTWSSALFRALDVGLFKVSGSLGHIWCLELKPTLLRGCCPQTFVS